MSEKDPKEEFLKSFGPREKGEATLFLLFEYKDKTSDLSKEDQQLLQGKMTLLGEEIRKDEQGDEEMIMGLTSEIKGFLLDKLGCPPERLTIENLIQFHEAYLKQARQERGSEGGAEQDPFMPPKKKEYKN